jgi:hypothetical protein
MIVRPADHALLLIAQPDHARLSGTIMERSVALAAERRREAILHAIREHDNGWAEEDAVPLVDPATGAVIDFVSAPAVVRHRVWPRGVARLGDDPWAAALVAQHAVTVYDRYRADAEWTAFFGRMEALRDGLRREAGLTQAELAADYRYVRLGDLLSLVFCTGWTDEHRFDQWTVRLVGSRVVVTPDAFGGAVVPIAITAHAIRKIPYRSESDLRDARGQAEPVVLHGEVAGSEA